MSATSIPPGTRVLIVEDDPPMRRFLRAALVAQGLDPIEASTARDAVAAMTTHAPELILLDLGLPDADGLEVTRTLRGWSHVPVIVISARGREDDKVTALDAGADDYLTKPFSVNELLARMRVALRHARRLGSEPETSEIEVGELRVDLGKRLVTVAGREVRLTPIEFRLLALLARHRGKVLTHAQILREVWGAGYAEETHYVRVYLSQLRRKIEPDPARPRWIVTEPAVGYRLRDV